MIWRDGGVFEIETIVDPAAGWTNIGVAAINNVGQIAGWATGDGHTHAVVLTPVQ